MHLLLSATMAIAALSASVIGVPTPLDTRTNAVARDVIDRSPSKGITQNDGCAPGKYICGKYYPDINFQLIVVCDATGTWIRSADCAGISCRPYGNQLVDRNGVPEVDRAFCDAKNGHAVRDATAKGLFLTRISPSERTTQSDDCLPSKYACDTYSGGPRRALTEACDAQSNWQPGANCNCAEGCHLGGTIYEDSRGVLQGDTAFCQCTKAHDSADSGSLTGGILADNSFDVTVREDVASNPTTDFTDFC